MPGGFLEDAAQIKNDETSEINLKEMEIISAESNNRDSRRAYYFFPEK